MRILILASCFALFFLGCKKESLFKIDASKITAVDENGVPNGESDPGDWKFNDDWNSKELALSSFADTIDRWGMQKASTLSAMLAPNPASSTVSLTFSADKPTFLKWVITDEYLNVLFQRAVRMEAYSTVNPNIGFMLDVRNNKFQKPGYYRVYYAFYSQDGTLYKKGHGDFQKL